MGARFFPGPLLKKGRQLLRKNETRLVARVTIPTSYRARSTDTGHRGVGNDFRQPRAH